MAWFGLKKDRGASVNTDFIPYNADGWILRLGGLGNTDDFSNIATATGQALAYSVVAPVQTVINRKAEAFANGRLWVLDKDGNEAAGGEAQAARELLQNPNPLQTWEEFYLQQKVYKNIFGYCPIYAIRPIGISTVIALYNILPTIFEAAYTGKLFQTEIKGLVKSYRLSYSGYSSELRLNDIYISKDITPSMTTGKLLPESRLTSLRYDIASGLALPEAKYTMVVRRGALGILSNESKDAVGSLPITKEEKEQIQREYREFGLSPKLNQIIITEANLKWQQMGISTKDLMLVELGEDATIRIADAFGYPYELLGSQKGVTFSNKGEAKKQFYQDTVIPEAKADSQALTRFLGLVSCHVDIDFSNISVLQEDRKQNADTLNITVNALTSAINAGILSKEEARLELSKLIDINPKGRGNGQG